jgi:glucose-1-phosphatase
MSQIAMTALPKVIMFDVGNVLINVDHLAIGIGLANASDNTSFRDRAVLLASIREWRTSPLIAAFEEGRLSAEQFYDRMKEAYRLNASFDRFCDIWNSGFSENTPVVRIVQRLVGRTRLLALSNTDPVHFAYISKAYPVFGWMEEVITSYAVGSRKPAANIYAYALRRAGVEASQTWYVDDRAEFVDAAARLGMRGIHYQTPAELAHALGVE